MKALIVFCAIAASGCVVVTEYKVTAPVNSSDQPEPARDGKVMLKVLGGIL